MRRLNERERRWAAWSLIYILTFGLSRERGVLWDAGAFFAFLLYLKLACYHCDLHKVFTQSCTYCMCVTALLVWHCGFRLDGEICNSFDSLLSDDDALLIFWSQTFINVSLQRCISLCHCSRKVELNYANPISVWTVVSKRLLDSLSLTAAYAKINETEKIIQGIRKDPSLSLFPSSVW